jgi:hypothetical protein
VFSAFSSKLGYEEHIPGQTRDWNEELQTTRELPRKNLPERLLRERAIFKVSMSFKKALLKDDFMAIATFTVVSKMEHSASIFKAKGYRLSEESGDAGDRLGNPICFLFLMVSCLTFCLAKNMKQCIPTKYWAVFELCRVTAQKTQFHNHCHENFNQTFVPVLTKCYSMAPKIY